MSLHDPLKLLDVIKSTCLSYQENDTMLENHGKLSYEGIEPQTTTAARRNYKLYILLQQLRPPVGESLDFPLIGTSTEGNFVTINLVQHVN
jgi:hypothetical protein